MIIAIIVIGLIAMWSAWSTWQNTQSIKSLLEITILLNESKYGEVIQIKKCEQEQDGLKHYNDGSIEF